MPETALAEALVEFEDARTYLKLIASSGDTVARDDLLVRLINYATGQIEGHCGWPLKYRTFTDWRMVDGTDADWIDTVVYGDFVPTALEELDPLGNTLRTIDITGYRSLGNGILRFPLQWFIEGHANHRITGAGGLDMTTAAGKALTGAALRWLQMMWQDQQGGAGRNTSITVDGLTKSFDYRLPDDIKRALEPFRRVL